ncbi:ABC transporter permease [Ornithinimicrobium cryptoxanthini]|uniref:ABC transporter permease n=1 Tax=Ornithinimicrobium cryptoxanthini TaxID=2934161 RepID=UPI002118D743|nr:ABC transporter permease [Ornithinimicrobium cryptoxanthini]
MSTSTLSPARSRTGTRGLPTLIAAELRLFLRDPGSVFFVLAFPTVLLIGMGFAIPGMRDPITDLPEPWLGLRAVDLFVPLMLCVAAATAGLTTVPSYLASYRETGVLRRMATTPMRPQGVLIAQAVVQLAAVAVGCALALLTARLVFDAPMAQNPALALLVLALATTAMFGIGVLIGGLASKASTASGIGMLIYFPMLFLAGLWTPGPMMPDAVEKVATYTPLGAASQAMNDAWFGPGMPWVQLVVMAAWTVAMFVIAARTFRWEV